MNARLMAGATLLALALATASAAFAEQVLWFNPIDVSCIPATQSCGLVDASLQRTFSTTGFFVYFPLSPVPTGLRVTGVVTCTTNATGSWSLQEWNGMDAPTLLRASDTFDFNGCDTTSVTPFVPDGPLTFVTITNNGMHLGPIGLRVTPVTSDVSAAAAPPNDPSLRIATTPNPFGVDTQVTYETLRAGRLDVVVYDIRGRKLRSLYSGERAAGTYQAAWDGRDEAGDRLPAGVYFIRVTAGSGESSLSRAIRLEGY